MIPGPFHLDAEGYFQLGGQRILPVGVNYWPASCGVRMWTEWPEAEIRKDLDRLVELEANCVRFFLLWEDFEPAAGVYNDLIFGRLTEFLGWCRDKNLWVQPSLFVGWMSGGIFWPEWKRKRNLFADKDLRSRAGLFAARVAEVCRDFPETILAIDQGNEICCLPDCLSAPPDDVQSWCGEISAAIRSQFAGVLIISGNEQAQVTADTGWRFGQQPGCDLYSMHSYPNSAWHSLRFDGMTDPLGQSLFPLYIKCARAFGPVMAQEFGTIFTAGNCCDEYLRKLLPACWDAGANGFLWWGLRDFTAPGHPYNKNAFEGPLGLLNEDDNIKPALRYFQIFARTLADRKPPLLDQGELGLYWPKHYYLRDDPHNPGNEPSVLSRRLAIAHFVCSELGYRVGVVRGGLKLDGISAHTIVVTGSALTKDETIQLCSWARSGGRLILQGVDVTTWGSDMNDLVGAAASDLRAPHANGVKAFGEHWNFSDFSRGIFVETIPITAKVLAADDRGLPVIMRNNIGNGVVLTSIPQVDDHFARRSEERSTRSKWKIWYAGLLGLVGSAAPADAMPNGSVLRLLESSS